MNPTNNYEQAVLQAQALFLNYDQNKMLQRFLLEADNAYLYINFVGERYRICRGTGLVERPTAGGWERAKFNAAMSIFDLLCNANGCPVLTGEWGTASSGMKATMSGALEQTLFAEKAERFAGREDALRAACIALDGVETTGADVAYTIAAFDWLPVQMRFWSPDDEFPATIQLYWDKATLRYIHYETTYYVADRLFDRLGELAGAPPRTSPRQ